jgi:hypothetical protein
MQEIAIFVRRREWRVLFDGCGTWGRVRSIYELISIPYQADLSEKVLKSKHFLILHEILSQECRYVLGANCWRAFTELHGR